MAHLASLTVYARWEVEDLSGLQCLTALTSLSVTRNSVSDVSPLSELTGLTELDLGWNQISVLGPLSGLNALTSLLLPEERPAEGERWSLLIVLHSAGGSGSTMVDRFQAWGHDGYVVCAPKAKDLTWEPNDLERTLAIAKHLIEVLPIDARKVHVAGYENGGDEMSPLVFDDDLKPCSVAWLTSGYRGTQVPKWAKTALGAIALAGTEDGNHGAAKATVPMLRDKVRNVEFHEQPGLGHAFPRELMPYLKWWMGVQEGRLELGDDRYFDWKGDLAAAVASQEGYKKGGVLLWLYAADDAEKEATRTVQHEIFFDTEVRFLARQIPCVKIDVLVRDHPSPLFLRNTTRRRGLSSLEMSTSRGTFSTTFQGRTSLPLAPHFRRDPRWILLCGRTRSSRMLRTSSDASTACRSRR